MAALVAEVANVAAAVRAQCGHKGWKRRGVWMRAGEMIGNPAVRDRTMTNPNPNPNPAVRDRTMTNPNPNPDPNPNPAVRDRTMVDRVFTVLILTKFESNPNPNLDVPKLVRHW